MAVVATDDRRVTITLDESGETASFALDAIGPRSGTWIDYAAGTARALTESGRPITGFRGVLASTLPIAAGLSSSAALEMAVALALLGSEASVSAIDRALAGQQAENDYVGVASGVMDQVASAAGVAGHAIRIDCRSLEWRPVPLPISEVAIVVCHSGSSRRLDTSAYNARRAECDRAVAEIAAIEPWVTSLRDVDVALLAAAEPHMDPVAARRARHVVGENARVLETEVALAAGDLAAVGRLFAGESRLAARSVRGQLARARCPGRDRRLDRRRRRCPDDRRRVRRIRPSTSFGTVRWELFREAIERDYPPRTGLVPISARGRCRRRGWVHGRLINRGARRRLFPSMHVDCIAGRAPPLASWTPTPCPSMHVDCIAGCAACVDMQSTCISADGSCT